MLKTSTHALSALLVTSFVGCSGPTTGHGGATSLAPTSAPANVPLREPSAGTTPSVQPPTAHAPSVAAPPDLALPAEQRVTLPSQASFVAPTGWFLRDARKLVRLWVPERDLAITIVDVGPAKDRDAAVAAAWAAVQPTMNLPVAQASDLPGRDGWEAMAQLAYVTPTAESRTVIALAMRSGTAWYVCLIDGKNAALQRRGAQLGAMLESLSVPDMIKESFAGKTAKLDAGEWQTTPAEWHDRDGAVKLATTGAPLVGLEFVVAKPGTQRALTLDFGQQVYTFDAFKNSAGGAPLQRFNT